ncbi:VCBS repeat-containing protein [Polaribacter vadi]|uniref:VCBS repeat-containing protein n=1 Tax=Polaribacter TaxID=52959 RepID=UPI001C0A1301|nr:MULTISPECIES: VCBS repeat-containing protein [Polaribacter]MBU3012830.1 VCBS repeat-containing protein [Polaribacter vadi]MDO6742646.1 VCBS repeat-containing protein [Polaribacter sp. 1_MG-2023]
MYKSIIISLICLVLFSCSDKAHQQKTKTIFTQLLSEESKINFSNNLKETDSLNYFKYTSIYMGGGVSVGDINNDGLVDLFFTGNQVSNKLYLNKGNLQFEDITKKANISGDDRWYTGATMADVNNDGYLDIYCAVAGKNGVKNNQLFINNKDNTFTEKAKEYHIDNEANSVQSTFFDYDNDGDLDLYIANYPIAHPSTSNMIYKNRMQNASDKETDKLFRNDGTYFTDVTDSAGVKNYSFSLGITAADINNDGWQDLYVSNDYSIPDFLYINNKNGTFKEVVNEATSQTSFYGMGIDISDINNDGFLDVFQVDMESNNNRRQKANMASMNPKLFFETVFYGFHYQYMSNCLQLNSGLIDDGIPKFSNISRLTGMSSTDWSWGPLFADFDNDGFKDLYITNGTRREVNNKDYFKKIDKKEYDKYSLLEKTKMIPSEKIDNFMYKNQGNLNFDNVGKKWGLEHKGFSNGAAYADLDNDGDLEIIINNIDEKATIFNNHSSENSSYLKIRFKGNSTNKFGLGNRVYAYAGHQKQMQELTLTRGFQSSVAPELHFGFNQEKKIDSLQIVWQNGKKQTLKNVFTNQLLMIDYKDSEIHQTKKETKTAKNLFTETTDFLKAKHTENVFNDFDKQVLLPHKMSTLGPSLAVADVNNDGLEDYFIGGSFGISAQLYVQKNGNFIKTNIPFIEKDKLSEDLGSLFFDADADGDLDLYVVSGGYEYAQNSSMLQDRLYVNDGVGNFEKSKNALPKLTESGSKVYQLDYNKDGKQDVLVLGRQVPGKYPLAASSYLLENKTTSTDLKFIKNKTKLFTDLGMATSAIITDFNNDSWQDIIIVGEWMSIKIYKNNKGTFEDVSTKMGLSKDTTGWWWSINQGDFDNDGDLDYILGNNGLNYKYKATENETFDIYVNDFDKNNKSDIVLSYYNDGEQYPLRGRQCSSQQIPGIKNKFKNYDEFSTATLIDVYGKQNLEKALHYQVKSFASIYLENKGDSFKIHQLPIEAQFSSIQKILVNDYDKDGKLDALIAGNLHNSEVETPRNDASYGLFLKGKGNGTFKATSVLESGFYVSGDVKEMTEIQINNTKHIIVGKNNDEIQYVKINN